MSTILKFGTNYYDLPINVVSQVETFRNLGAKKDMILWSFAEYTNFINSIENDVLYKTFFMFLYMTGCRKGEAFALSWEDIDFDTNKLHIHKTLLRRCKAVNGVKPLYKVDNQPKNFSSNRTISLPKSLILQLKKYKETQTDSQQTDFVFGGKNPLSLNTPSRTLKRYCVNANVKIITLHDFRHSHASLLISMGESIVMVSKRLGHANIEQTLNTYSHLMPNQESEMIERLDCLN